MEEPYIQPDDDSGFVILTISAPSASSSSRSSASSSGHSSASPGSFGRLCLSLSPNRGCNGVDCAIARYSAYTGSGDGVACSHCDILAGSEKIMHEADALFEGIALDWKERSNPNDSLYVETRFKVLRSWSGDLPEIIRVHTQFLQCELGKTYRIAAYKGEDGALQTNFCVQFHVDQIRQLNWEASVAVFNRVEVDD